MQKKKVKIYGERNTGTRVLELALHHNFEVEIIPGHGTLDKQAILSDIRSYQLGTYEGLLFKEALCDDDILRNESTFLGWKHACPPLPEIQAYACLPETLFLIMSKDPLDWLRSLHRRPYHVLYQKKLNFSEFIRHYWLSLRCEHLPWSIIKNPIQLYGLKLAAYQQLCDLLDLMGGAYLHIPYEKLIGDFSGLMDQLANHLSPKKQDLKNTTWIIPLMSSKNEDLTFFDYQKKYLNQSRFQDMLMEDRAFIRSELDPEQLSIWGYDLLSCLS